MAQKLRDHNVLAIHPIIKTFYLEPVSLKVVSEEKSADYQSTIHPLGTVNVCTNFHGNPFEVVDIGISVQTKKVGRLTD